jgi:GMP synthase-like glutamine amidotransferase
MRIYEKEYRVKIKILQHGRLDGTANICCWLKNKGHEFSITHLYKGDKLQHGEEFDFLIALGGPMNVDQEDKYPWLKEEKIYIRQAIDDGKKILGICLGGQLIARATGHPVKKNPHMEIGWHKIEIIEKNPFTQHWPKDPTFFHWHEDTFEVPQGAKLIARSTACERQAYILGDNIVGTQFHPEVNYDWIKDCLEGEERFPDGPHVQQAEEILAKSKLLVEQSKIYLFSLLDALESAKPAKKLKKASGQ